MSAPRRLSHARAPDEAGAEQRGWAVTRAAYAQRVPARRRARPGRLLLVPALAALAAAAALTPAGATVGRWIRHALAAPHVARATLSLPAPGRVLVSGRDGAWIVSAGGSRRRLGAWAQASFSPHGRYLAVASASTLAAIDPLGRAQWMLTRPHVSDPRWWPPLGYWVAYLSASSLRVVMGNGLGDRLLAAHVERVAPAWRPGWEPQVAYVAAPGSLVVRNAATGSLTWRRRTPERPIELTWSNGGTRLLVLFRARALVFDARGDLVSSIGLAGAAPARAGALSPGARFLALVRGGTSDAVVYDLAAASPSPTRVFAGAGLGQLAWSPNGRWLLITWPAADEWIFVPAGGHHRALGVSRIAERFASAGGPGAYPRLDGWCCQNTAPASR